MGNVVPYPCKTKLYTYITNFITFFLHNLLKWQNVIVSTIL